MLDLQKYADRFPTDMRNATAARDEKERHHEARVERETRHATFGCRELDEAFLPDIFAGDGYDV